MNPFAPLCNGLPAEMAPGIYLDMPRETYDRIPALSATVVKKWRSGGAMPSKFAWWLANRWSEPMSDALLVGQALDCLLLDAEHFDDHFITVPDGAPPKPNSRIRQAKNPGPSSVAAIAYWDKFNRQAESKHILTFDQYQACVNMRAALYAAEATQDVFKHCRKAVLVGTLFGQPAKAEIDLWNERETHIMDLKKAVDVSPTQLGFFGAIARYGYIDQATWYLLLAQALGIKKESFSFIGVECEEPWSVKVHSFAPYEDPKHNLMFHATEARLKRAVEAITHRLEKRNFKDSQDWELITFPEWMLHQAQLDTVENYLEVA